MAEFWLCILWSLVRSPVVEITVYTADETCPVLYVTRKCLPDFLVIVIQFRLRVANLYMKDKVMIRYLSRGEK